jgi:hypothetical protein
MSKNPTGRFKLRHRNKTRMRFPQENQTILAFESLFRFIPCAMIDRRTSEADAFLFWLWHCGCYVVKEDAVAAGNQ